MQQDNSGASPLDRVWAVVFEETGHAPLFEAVHWVATKGGLIHFHPDLWTAAWAKVSFAWRNGELKVLGRPIGRPIFTPEPIPGDEIAGEIPCIPPYPSGLHDLTARRMMGDPTSSTGYCIEFWCRSDRASWRDGFNDKFFLPGKRYGWTHLTVSKADVERIWSFGSAMEVGAAQGDVRHIPDNPPLSGRTKRPLPIPTIAWKAIKFNSAWSKGIPKKLSYEQIAEKINTDLLPKMRQEGKIDRNLLDKCKGGVSDTSVKRALGVR